MPTLPQDKLDTMTKRFDSIEAALASGPSAEDYVRLSKEYAELEPVVRPIQAYQKLVQDLADAEDLLKAGDKEMAEMAEAEIEELKPRIEAAVQNIRILLLPKDAADEKSVILEVRGGTGGDEAALFAGDLLRMYQRYADLKGWKFQLLEESPGEVGGYKEVIANISGKGVYAKLKFESGVHRVQRVPDHRDAGPHPHLRRHRRGAARGRGDRHRHRARRHPHRHDALVRRRRPARQHHRLGGAHHAYPDRHRRHRVARSRSTRTAPPP